MTTARTWAINAAFLQEVKDFNTDYWKTYNQLQHRTLARGNGESASDPVEAQEILNLARQITKEMAKQFLLEETYGYLQTPTGHGAVYDSEVACARGQHKSLYMLASEICESLELAGFQGLLSDGISKQEGAIRKLCNDWAEHEQSENNLIQSVTR
ncbi:MAG: hypothetical protein RLY14_2406 [Planctomycetota bacterium]|jgi:hypothetical protein